MRELFAGIAKLLAKLFFVNLFNSIENLLTDIYLWCFSSDEGNPFLASIENHQFI